MDACVSKERPVKPLLTGDSIDFTIGLLLILGGLLYPPLVAYYTQDWIWTIVPTLWWAAFAVSVADYVGDTIHSALRWMDERRGIKSDPKLGLLSGAGFCVGLFLSAVSAAISAAVLGTLI